MALIQRRRIELLPTSISRGRSIWDVFRRKGPAEDVTFDPAFGDADAAALRTAMAAGDWPAAVAVLTAGHDEDDFSFLVDVASRVPGGEEWLPEVVRANLDDPLPLLVYGARAIDFAWEARTGARAEYVGRDRFEIFFERLRLAEDCLQDVVRRDPANITAWTGLVTVARGLELGQDEARRRFDQVVRRYPTHVRAHTQMLQQVCRKWGGSHEKMHAFAWEAVRSAPPGNRLGSLVAEAHLEHWMDQGTEGGMYFRSKQVLAELHEAADLSVRHPDYRVGKGWPKEHNAFAMAFALAGDVTAAADLFRVIGDLATEFPWQYYQGDAARAFTTCRRIASGSR